MIAARAVGPARTRRARYRPIRHGPCVPIEHRTGHQTGYRTTL